jgi:hypothetical protein
MAKVGDGNPNLVVNFVVLFLEHLLMLPPGLTEIKHKYFDKILLLMFLIAES